MTNGQIELEYIQIKTNMSTVLQSHLILIVICAVRLLDQGPADPPGGTEYLVRVTHAVPHHPLVVISDLWVSEVDKCVEVE